MELEPALGIAHFELGRANLQQGLHEEALKNFKRAAELNGIYTPGVAYLCAVSTPIPVVSYP